LTGRGPCSGYGYPSHVLPILNERFGTYEKAKQLLSYGDMSVLGSKLEPDDGDVHNFNTRQPDVCVFYNRDRGETEKFTKAQQCLSKLEISKEEFNYFFDERRGWSVV